MYKIITMLLFAVLLPSASSAEESDPKATRVICAAADAIIATKMEPGIFADSIKSEAQRHANLARKYGATNNDISQALKAIQLAYNEGEWSWEKITELGKSCSQIK